MAELRKVAIIGGARIPFCRAFTGYRDETNLSMLTGALAALSDKYGLKGAHIDEVIAGAVLNQSRDFNLAREAALNAGFAPSTPGTTVQIACGTSLEAALLLGAKIASGEIECGIAGGADSVSNSPIVFSDKFAHRLADFNRAKGAGQKWRALHGFSFGEIAPLVPSTSEPRTGLSMGEHCELMAREWDISREAQDEWAIGSHRKAAAAYEAGFHDDLVAPHAGIVRDNNIRADSTPEKLAALPPAFDKRSGRGTLTAANSTPLTDGAAAVLLCSEEWAAARGLKVTAWLEAGAVSANDFAHGDGLLMAPTVAVSNLFRRKQLSFADIDLFEIHEAFAAQLLCTLRAFADKKYCKDVLDRDKPLGRIDEDKINPKGSSVAYGHPFAATGARILALTAKQLATEGHRRALISVCTAGGMGVAALVSHAGE